MGRPLRIDYEGAWHHVTNRGARRGPIFDSDLHCFLFMEVLGEVVMKKRLEVHAYALLPNHFHLLVRSAEGNLSAAMKQLGESYTRRLNRTEGWDGPTFRGRFASKLITDEKYLRFVVAYIHLNPVRARLVKRPDEECWTSHRALCGLDHCPGWLSHDMIAQQFGSPEQLDAFVKDLWRSKVPWPAEVDRDKGWLGTNPDYQPKTARARFEMKGGAEIPLADPEVVLARVCEVTGATEATLKRATRGRGANPARRFAIWMLGRHTRLTHAAIGREVDASRSQVEKLLHRLRRSVPPDLAKWCDEWDARSWPER